MARRISHTHPLPLPSFRTLESLSLPELVAICRRHSELIESTSALPMLEPIKHRRVNITGQGGPRGIYEFGFLPGGRYLMIVHRNGAFTCWDSLQDSGVELAEFLTGGVITSWNFHVHTDKAEVTVVLVTRRGRNSYWLQVLRVTFSLDDADQLKFEEIITVPVPFDCPAIQIHCDHVWSTGCLGDDELLLFVLLFKDKRHVLINTGIRH
ncbi:hypothetical protein FRB95_012380, partial [Tulasnella sp. JGI-2019a]